MKNVVKDFRIDNSKMLVKSQVFLNAFINNKAIFIAKSPVLEDPFAAEFQSAIDFAKHLPFPDEINSIISVIVESLKEKMIVAQSKLQVLYMYVKIGWDSDDKIESFGRNKYQKSRKSYSKMIDLLKLANRKAELVENKTVLLSVGYTQLEIDELNAIADEIKALFLKLNDLKSNRYIQTNQRITAMNDVWKFMQKVNKVSKIAFINNPAMIKLFSLY